jgi:20S proteasome alpha/beta subunit
MTLIAAFRCYEGVVLCADQQETVGGFRVAVNKIAPQDCGNYQLAFAGSGNGDLIDGLAYALRLDVERWQSRLSEAVIMGNIRNLLLDFHQNEIALYPAASTDDKLNHCLVCIKPKDTTDIYLWELRGSVIVPVGDYALLGVGEAIYAHELKRLYRGTPRGLQAVLLGIHLFSLAKETSNYVGGQTDVIFVRDNGMTQEDPHDVKVLERRIADFNERIAELVLLCPDTSTPDDELRGFLANFQDGVMQMREDATKFAAASSLLRTLRDPNYTGDPYPKVPPGQLMAMGRDGQVEVFKQEETSLFINEVEQAATPPSEPEQESPPPDSQETEG